MTLLTAARLVRRLGLDYSIRTSVDCRHVGTPETEIAAEWQDRVARGFCRRGTKGPGALVRAIGQDTVTAAVTAYATAVHRRNRRVYRRVMRGF